MSYCKNCGTKLKDGAKFCLNCGEKVTGNGLKKVMTNKVENWISGEKNRTYEKRNEKKHSSDDSYQTGQRVETYAGAICKCPNCGEQMDSFTLNCPTCGYELRNANITSAANTLLKKIEIAKDEDDEDIEKIIRNFYIPNTKEDIYEFYILAKTNAEADDENSSAWEAKLEQVYQKAKIASKSAPEFNEIILYVEKYKKKKEAKEKKDRIVMIVIIIVALIFVVGFIIFLFLNPSEPNLTLPDTEIAQTIPTLDKSGEIITNTQDTLVFEYESVSKWEFRKYKKECKKKGYDKKVKNGSSFFEAKNKDGYYLEITYNNEKMKVSVTKED